MSKLEQVRASMYEAMKSKDKERKDALSMLMGALKNETIDLRRDLTDEESDVIIRKEIRQTKETLETTPADRTELIEQCKLRIAVYEEFVPAMMDEAQIRQVIEATLKEAGIENPTPKEKGIIMKQLMPKVKGKADGKLVNELLSTYFS